MNFQRFLLLTVLLGLAVVACNAQNDLTDDIGDLESEEWDSEERAWQRPPSIGDCTTSGVCGGFNSTNSTSTRNVVLCCDYYNRCCGQSRSIECPKRTIGTTVTPLLPTEENSCSPYGPFCRIQSNCPVGTRCCPNTDGTFSYKCCWRPY